jgi:predicted Co/Zn/Cd cation transporter (cation efflux family)
MRPLRKSHMSSAVLGVTLLIIVIQLYLFETVLGSVLDGERRLLQGAFWVSLLFTIAALYLAFKVRNVDDGPKH